MIALHAALLARKVGKPVRMIYDRHEDMQRHHQAPPGDRPPPHRRHARRASWWPRTSTWSWTAARTARSRRSCCRAASCTPAARIGARTCGSAVARWPPTRRRTARSAASARRRPSSPPRCRSTASPRRSAFARSSCAGAGSYREGDTTPTGQVLRESVAGIEVLEAAAEAASSSAHSAQTRAQRARRGSRAARLRVGHRPGAGLARRRLHRQRRGPLAVVAVGRADRRRADPRPDRLDRDGPGHQDDLPAAGGRGLGVELEEVEMAPQDTSIVPDAARPSPRARRWSSAGCIIKAARAAAGRGRGSDRPALRRVVPRLRAQHGPLRVDERFEPYPGRALRRRDLHRRRLPGLRLGVRRGARSTSTWTPARWRCATVVVGRRRRPRHPPGPGRGPGRGRHAAGGRLRDDRGDQAGRRPLPERPAGDLPDPDRARRAADRSRSSSRSRTPARRTAPRASASCRWTSARRRSWPRSTTRPASGSTTCRRRRSASSRR